MGSRPHKGKQPTDSGESEDNFIWHNNNSEPVTAPHDQLKLLNKPKIKNGEEVRFRIYVRLESSWGKNHCNYFYWLVFFDVVGPIGVGFGPRRIIDTIQVLKIDPPVRWYDTNVAPLGPWTLETLSEKNANLPFRTQVQFGHHTKLQGNFILKDGGIIPFSYDLPAPPQKDGFGDDHPNIPYPQDGFVDGMISGLPKTNDLMIYTCHDQGISIVAPQRDPAKIQKIILKGKTIQADQIIDLLEQEGCIKIKLSKEFIWRGAMSGLYSIAIEAHAEGHPLFRLFVLEINTLKSYMTLLRNNLKFDVNPALILEQDKFEPHDLPEQLGISQTEMELVENSLKSIIIKHNRLGQWTKTEDKNSNHSIENILDPLILRHRVRSQKRVALHDLPIKDQKKKDECFPEDFLKLPGSATIVKRIQTILQYWEEMSKENWGHRLARQKLLAATPKVTYCADRLYLLLIIRKTKASFPKDLVRTIAEYLPPVLQGGNCFMMMARGRDSFYRSLDKTTLKLDVYNHTFWIHRQQKESAWGSSQDINTYYEGTWSTLRNGTNNFFISFDVSAFRSQDDSQKTTPDPPQQLRAIETVNFSSQMVLDKKNGGVKFSPLISTDSFFSPLVNFGLMIEALPSELDPTF